MDSLKGQLVNYEKDKQALSSAKRKIVENEKQIKNLKWENEVVQQKLEKVTKEKDQILNNYEESIFDVQQKSQLKSI